MSYDVKKAKEQADKILENRTIQRDGENRVVINMTIKDDSNFLSVFSQNETPVVSSEVADFIEDSIEDVLPKEALTLRVFSDCIDDGEKLSYEKAIKEYYTEKYVSNERRIKRNNVMAFVLGFFGIAVLASALFLDVIKGSMVWAEVVDVFAWVLLWEAVDIFAFKNNELKIKRYRFLALMFLSVEYYPVDAQTATCVD